jgi:hypothetical protein
LATVSQTVSTPEVVTPTPGRSIWDQRARRVLRLPVDGPPTSVFGAHGLFGRSIAVSAVRCLITYVMIPVLGPIIGVSGVVGPWLGLALSIVSTVAIVFATRRFFGADHKYRWIYAAVGGGIIVLLAVQSFFDVRTLLS